MARKAIAEPQECCPSVLTAPLGDDDAAVLARAFAALADPIRLRLLSLIASRDEVCACELVEAVGRSQPTVSHHLRTLYDAGLVERERRGTWIWYRVAHERVDDMRRALAAQ
jgi:ArsR family transcriptional regulator